jgi:O-antigen ligase
MDKNAITPTINRVISKPEILAALAGGVLFIALILFFKTSIVLAAFLAVIVGGLAFWMGFEYIPLIVFLQLALSVELQIGSTTRLTVPTEIIVPLLFVAYAITVLRTGKISYRASQLNIAVIIMYFVMVASFKYSFEPTSTIKAIIRDTGYMGAGYFLIPQYIRSEKHIKHILYSCLGIHTLLVLYGFITQVIGGLHIYGDIAAPFFVEHCIYAAYITISFAFLLPFYLTAENEKNRLWLGLLTALFGAAIILTFVRAAWISVFVLLLFYLFQFRNRKSAIDLILLMIVGSLLGLVIAVSTDVGGMILQRLDTITETNYTANLDRIDRWIVAWKIWIYNPILGVGWGAYPDHYFKYAEQTSAFYDAYFFNVPYSSAFRMGAHNIYLELLAEVGVVGLMSYLLVIYIFFRRALIMQHKIKSDFQRIFLIGAQGAIITYLVHAFVNNLGPSDKMGITFWFIIGIVPTIEALYRSDQKNALKESSK